MTNEDPTVHIRREWANIGLVTGIERGEDGNYEWAAQGVINRLELAGDTLTVRYLTPNTKEDLIQPIVWWGFHLARRDQEKLAHVFCRQGDFVLCMEIRPEEPIHICGVHKPEGE